MWNSTRPSLAAAVCVLGLAAGLHVPGADAASTRGRYTRPSGICEAPLPIYDASLRKAPLAITNTGQQDIFINCALPSDPVADVDGGWMQIDFASTAAVSASVNCTMITGTADQPVYHSYSRSVSPGGTNWFTWTSIDKVSADGIYAFICSLPPGIQMTGTYLRETDSDNGL